MENGAWRIEDRKEDSLFFICDFLFSIWDFVVFDLRDGILI